MKRILCGLILAISAMMPACRESSVFSHRSQSVPASQSVTPISSPILQQVIRDALEQTKYTVHYDPAYVKIDYPGDVPSDRGVCADVIVSAFRKGGVDLQKVVHEDMERNFSAYPNRWGLAKPDSNIDHRRVLNLMTYFSRQGKSLSVSTNATDYLPGDVVAWELGDNHPHIGIVMNVKSGTAGNFFIVHNISGGARMEDVLFSWQIMGHYRYFGGTDEHRPAT